MLYSLGVKLGMINLGMMLYSLVVLRLVIYVSCPGDPNIEVEPISTSHNDAEYESEPVPEQSSNDVFRSLDQLEQENARLRSENAKLHSENLQLKHTIETLNTTVQRLNLMITRYKCILEFLDQYLNVL